MIEMLDEASEEEEALEEEEEAEAEAEAVADSEDAADPEEASVEIAELEETSPVAWVEAKEAKAGSILEEYHGSAVTIVDTAVMSIWENKLV